MGKFENSKNKNTVEKQIKAFKKAQQSYVQITEKTAERINRANESTRTLHDIQRSQKNFIASQVLRDHHIVSKEARMAYKKRGGRGSSCDEMDEGRD